MSDEQQTKPEPEKTERTERTEKITNEKELSREQKTAVKKLKDYSREAKKHTKQSEQTEDDDVVKDVKKPGTPITTFIAFGTLLVGIAGLYFMRKNYLVSQVKAEKHNDVIQQQPTEKKTPRFKKL